MQPSNQLILLGVLANISFHFSQRLREKQVPFFSLPLSHSLNVFVSRIGYKQPTRDTVIEERYKVRLNLFSCIKKSFVIH